MMSNQKKFIGNFVTAAKAIGVAVGLLCVVWFCGCGTQDKAITFSRQEETVESKMPQVILEEEGQGLTQLPNEQNQAASGEAEKVYVHVCGAVISSGVVELPQGSRVEDALLAAGGFREDAAEEYVNLASKVEDGQKLYFPTKEEVETLWEKDGGIPQEMLGEETGQSDKVNINTADVALLCTLPGIGEARAMDIIAYRQEHGAFRTKEDIMQVSGIKQSAYEKISDKIIVQ